ncbi:MAG: hypothetical protein AB7N61_25115 [Acidimicrobiia bacterium]
MPNAPSQSADQSGEHPYLASGLGMPQFPADLMPSDGTGDHVMGVAAQAWLTTYCLRQWGPDWLERGTMALRFRRHLSAGDQLRIVLDTAGGDEMAGDGVGEAVETMSLAVVDVDGNLCSDGSASLLERAPRVDLTGFPVLPVPEPRIAPLPEHVDGRVLGTVRFGFDAERDLGFTQALGEPWWVEQGLAHPAWLVSGVNGALKTNVDFTDGRWVHAGMSVTQLRVVRSPAVISITCRFDKLFTAGGHNFADVGFVLCADDAPAMTGTMVIVYA